MIDERQMQALSNAVMNRLGFTGTNPAPDKVFAALAFMNFLPVVLTMLNTVGPAMTIEMLRALADGFEVIGQERKKPEKVHRLLPHTHGQFRCNCGYNDAVIDAVQEHVFFANHPEERRGRQEGLT